MDAATERIKADPILYTPLILLVVHFVWTQLTKKSVVPPELPWIGKKPGLRLFGDLRLRIEGWQNVRTWLADGYSNYSTKGKSYIYRTIVGTPEVIIPRDQLKWLLDFPDQAVSVSEVHYEMLGAQWTFTHPDLVKVGYHEHVIHKNLARKLSSILMDIWDEVGCSFDDTWGMDTNEWKELCVFDNAMDIIARISNRMFLGLPLCRNKDLLGNMGAFAQDVFKSAAIISMLPSFLKPILAPLICIPNHRHYQKTTVHTLPFIKERLANIKKKKEDPDWEWEEPNDYMSWYINTATAEGRTKELDPAMISRYIMPLNFAAIHTTVFTITNVLFDLVGSDPAKGYMAGIKEEVERVYREENGVWTKQGLNRLVRCDSALRESMRVGSFLTRGVIRKVMTPKGATNKNEGWTAPQNAFIAVDVNSIHHDPELYPDPNEFDAFRFSRPRELVEAGKASEKDLDQVLAGKNLSMVATSDKFLAFGHGRHACPGRFFVSHELKMYLAYMIMNYEVEQLPKRPDNVWIGYHVLPPAKATIRVKRKAGTVPN